jgi:hypothetical protein
VTTITDDGNSDDDIWTMLKTIQEQTKLSEEYKIPSKAWQLLSKEARDTFIAKCDNALKKLGSSSRSFSGRSLPKQYRGAGNDDRDPQQANLVTSLEQEEPESDSKDSHSTSTEDDTLVCLLQSYRLRRK